MINTSIIARLDSCWCQVRGGMEVAPGYWAAGQAIASRCAHDAPALARPLAIKLREAVKRFGRGLLAAREASAARAVRRHLACHSDAVLLAAGFSSEEISRLRDHDAARTLVRHDAICEQSCRGGCGMINDLLIFAARLRIGLRDRLQAHATIKTLSALDDRILRDIGLSRGEIKAAVRNSMAKPHRNGAAARKPCQGLEASLGSETSAQRGEPPPAPFEQAGQSFERVVILPRARMIGLLDCSGVTIHLWSGQLWITQADDYRDIIVQPGEPFQLDRNGLALVTATLPSVLCIAPIDARTRSRIRLE